MLNVVLLDTAEQKLVHEENYIQKEPFSTQKSEDYEYGKRAKSQRDLKKGLVVDYAVRFPVTHSDRVHVATITKLNFRL